MRRFITSLFVPICVISSCMFFITCGSEQRAKHFNATAADADSAPDRVVAVLEIKSGDIVGDLGAGGGFFTEKLSAAAGEKGLVYAIDINRKYLQIIDTAMKSRNIKNVKTVLAAEDSLNLPPRSVDLLFARNVFHEIENQAEYFKKIKPVLKSGGRVAIIDYKPVYGGKLFNKFLPEDVIIARMKEAGYRPVKRLDFLKKQSFNIFTAD